MKHHWRGDKRSARHAGLPRVPFSRRATPADHGHWLHYRVVPGLRSLRYVESRSGKNACLMVSKAQDRRMQRMAEAQGHENPAVMVIANLTKRFMAQAPDRTEGRAKA